jgi:Zn-dependent M28 family amino/carboxypeptidase
LAVILIPGIPEKAPMMMGAGCVQTIEVLRVLKALGYKPKRTIRFVLFMNEENGLRGGNKYAQESKRKK